MSIIYKEESYEIIGACFEVYNELGHGFLEGVYQEALELELKNKKVSFEPQKKLEIFYKGKKLNHYYIPDFVCHDKIILEIKAVKSLTEENKAQLFNYLKITGFKLGILVNFGSFPKIEYYRVVL